MAEIKLENIRKNYGKVVATNDVSLTIRDKEFMVLLGPSGCGKTTLLRAIAGLESIDGGRVLIGGRDVTQQPPRKRNISMVFQSYAVFPHLTVYDNIAFGLQMKRMPQAEIKTRVAEASELLRITDYLQRFPAQLSGGQRQRVAVARALAMPSEVLLMDEPLSNLDALLRLDMRAELKKLLRDAGATTVYVTHDQVEALSLGDRIAVMKQGNVLQCDAPLQVYDRPADAFVAGFIGNPPMNLLKVSELPTSFVAGLNRSGATVLGIRAENIETHLSPVDHALEARIIVIEPLGSHNLVTAQTGNQLIKINTRPEVALAPNITIWLKPLADKLCWLN
jgi:multiple sugar transport system ATP-binding protein